MKKVDMNISTYTNSNRTRGLIAACHCVVVCMSMQMCSLISMRQQLGGLLIESLHGNLLGNKSIIGEVEDGKRNRVIRFMPSLSEFIKLFTATNVVQGKASGDYHLPHLIYVVTNVRTYATNTLGLNASFNKTE